MNTSSNVVKDAFSASFKNKPLQALQFVAALCLLATVKGKSEKTEEVKRLKK